MNLLHNYESEMAAWFKGMPFHLPKSAIKWLGNNIWWLVIIGVASVVLSMVLLLQEKAILDFLRQYYTDNGIDMPAIRPTAELSKWMSLITLAGVAVLEIKAISPLKHRKKLGWDLLVSAAVINLIGSLLAGWLSGAFLAPIISTIISGFIVLFILFEIQPEFKSKKTKPKNTKQ